MKIKTESIKKRIYRGKKYRHMFKNYKEAMVSKSYLDSIISSMSDALIVLQEDETIETVNEAALEMLGYTKEEVIGQDGMILLPRNFSTAVKTKSYENLREHGCSKNIETSLHGKNGKIVPVLLCCSMMKQDSGEVKIVCTAKDVTERKIAQEEITYQANHDKLTGLVNRYALDKVLEQLCQITKHDSEAKHVFMYLDLDKFKIVNDVCGHYAGDELIKHLTLIMKKNIRKTDVLARIGGDEFGVLLPYTQIINGITVAENLCEVVKDFRFTWEGKQFTVGVSIGLVEINTNLCEADHIISTADRACYVSKEKGGNHVQVFNHEERVLCKRENEIRVMPSVAKAIEKNLFFLEFQPIVRTTDNEIKGYEALIRMRDENGEVVSPGTFLPAAQRYHLLGDIDRWVIDEFCKIYHERLKKEGESIIYNINISGTSVGMEGFLDYICDKLEAYQIPPSILCIEITETSAVSNFVHANDFITKLSSLGCKFALDDFGSGLSSYTYLKYLQVDFVKIDGSFVKDMVENELDYAFVSSINEIAHLMGKQTVAEYVESEAIYECLKEIGVDGAQGYWIGKPREL